MKTYKYCDIVSMIDSMIDSPWNSLIYLIDL